jgi:predicted alpha/beta-hydrolase family hydrolase
VRRSQEIETPRGPARVDLDLPEVAPASLLVLGHGAGGGVSAPDLVAVREAAVAHEVAVARVTQPYRLAGRRAPAPAAQLDEAWSAVVTALVDEVAAPVLVVGGRSSGARVACRTAGALGAAGVVALAFPLHPPARRAPAAGRSAAAAQSATEVDRERALRSRAGELATGLPTLVVNGDRDPFGIPLPAPGVRVEVRPGERHDLRKDPAGVAAVVVEWLRAHHWAR